jgi:hypothetical protein
VTISTGARGATNAVNVVGCLHRHIVVNNKRDPFHIDAARSDIGCNKYTILTIFESCERFFALPQKTISVNLRYNVTHALHSMRKLARTMLRSSKD